MAAFDGSYNGVAGRPALNGLNAIASGIQPSWLHGDPSGVMTPGGAASGPVIGDPAQTGTDATTAPTASDLTGEFPRVANPGVMASAQTYAPEVQPTAATTVPDASANTSRPLPTSPRVAMPPGAPASTGAAPDMGSIMNAWLARRNGAGGGQAVPAQRAGRPQRTKAQY